jgi:hypothetical protein
VTGRRGRRRKQLLDDPKETFFFLLQTGNVCNENVSDSCNGVLPGNRVAFRCMGKPEGRFSWEVQVSVPVRA